MSDLFFSFSMGCGPSQSGASRTDATADLASPESAPNDNPELARIRAEVDEYVRSPAFADAVRSAFHDADSDGNDAIDVNELYNVLSKTHDGQCSRDVLWQRSWQSLS